MIDYIFRLIFCSAFFIGIYYGFLQNERMYRFNRFYLILAAMGSVLIPILNFESANAAVVVAEKIISNGSQYVGNTIRNVEVQESSYISLNKVVGISYSVIGSILFVRLLVFNHILLKTAKQGKRKKLADAILVLTSNNHPPHSYFNYIFISKSEYENCTIDEKIIDHERAHVKQKHSVDVLLVELLLVVLWFNPFFYLYRNAIRLNHEYLADEAVISKHKNTHLYQHLLINNTALLNGLKFKSVLSCPFNYLKTKKRLKMMSKMKITHRIVLKQCLLIPMVLVAVLIFSNITIAREVKKAIDKEEVANIMKLATEETKITNALELRKAIAYNIKYPSVARENKVQGKVEVFVKIDGEGKVSNLAKKPTNVDFKLEEVVATCLISENDKRPSFNNESESLIKEVKRVVKKIPLIGIPEYYEKTVAVTVQFVLEEK